MKMNLLKMAANVKYDLPASLVVFFVALPLCLGIALASGAPLFAGIIAGIVGAKPSIFRTMYRLGWQQFIPFMVTVTGIVFTDLLRGIAIGMVVAIFFILREHYRNAYSLQHLPGRSNGKSAFRMELAEEVSFLNRANILKTLNKVDDGSVVIIDASKSRTIDHDVIEVIEDFTVNAKRRNIRVELVGLEVASGKKSSYLFEPVGPGTWKSKTEN